MLHASADALEVDCSVSRFLIHFLQLLITPHHRKVKCWLLFLPPQDRLFFLMLAFLGIQEPKTLRLRHEQTARVVLVLVILAAALDLLGLFVLRVINLNDLREDLLLLGP